MFGSDNVHNNPVPESFFDVEETTFEYTVNGYNTAGDNGVFISLKDGYTLRGKVTLPKSINGVKVKGLHKANNANDKSGFAQNDEITHIFWETGATPEMYTTSCLNHCHNLVYVEFPASLYIIQGQAFIGCNSLQNRDLLSASNLNIIQTSAFNQAFGPGNGTTFIIPANVRELGAFAFGYNTAQIRIYQLGEEGKPSQLTSMATYSPFAWNTDGYGFIIYTDDINKEIWTKFNDYAGNNEVIIRNV